MSFHVSSTLSLFLNLYNVSWSHDTFSQTYSYFSRMLAYLSESHYSQSPQTTLEKEAALTNQTNWRFWMHQTFLFIQTKIFAVSGHPSRLEYAQSHPSVRWASRPPSIETQNIPLQNMVQFLFSLGRSWEVEFTTCSLCTDLGRGVVAIACSDHMIFQTVAVLSVTPRSLSKCWTPSAQRDRNGRSQFFW